MTNRRHNLKLGALVAALSSFVAPAQATTVTAVTLTQELAAVSDLAPVYRYVTTDGIRMTSVVGPVLEVNNAFMNNAAVTTGVTDVLWNVDTSNNLIANVVVPSSSAWRTFQANSIAASWSATSTITLTETTRDGANPGGTAWTLDLTLTRTGTPPDLTRETLTNFLRRSTTAALTTTTSPGIALTSTGVLGTGWAASARVINNSSTGVSSNLVPIESSITFTVAPTSGATATAFTAVLTNLNTWNVATNSTSEFPVVFTAPGSRSITFNVLPAQFARTAGMSAGLIAALNATTLPRRINQTPAGHLNTLPQAIADIRSLLMDTPSGSVKAILNARVQAILANADFTHTTFPVAGRIGTDNGVIALTASDIQDLTWSVQGTVITARGRVGATGMLKNFTCDVSGLEVHSTSTNPVLAFAASDGDTFWLKATAGAGLDTSADTTVAAGNRDDLLALQILNLVSGQTSIPSRRLATFITNVLT